MYTKLCGIDLVGTKIEGAVLKSKDDQEVLVRKRIDTESGRDYQYVQNPITS